MNMRETTHDFVLAHIHPLWIAILSIGASETSAGEGPADLILLNGDFYTVNPKQPRAEAVAIRDTKLIAVGTDEGVAKRRGPKTHVIDLEGRFVVPGFIDTHVHIFYAAPFHEFNIMKTAQ